MDEVFLNSLYQKHERLEAVPSNLEIAEWAQDVIHVLFPEQIEKRLGSAKDIGLAISHLEHRLCQLMNATKACTNCNNEDLAKRFFNLLPQLYATLNADIEATFDGDPAAKSEFEVVRTYPGFYAICFYRVAHALYQLAIPLIPRILTEHAHSVTGIDIHPGAEIGAWFAVDHGTGIVIGETAQIGEHVKIYQGVTLGALHVAKALASTKRHPTVENGVIIYAGATILGGNTVIGKNCVIGGNVWITRSVAAGAKVYHIGETRTFL